MKKLMLMFFLILFSAEVLAKPIHVVLLNPGGDHWFWEMIIDFMQASAEDLDIQLEVITSHRNHILTIQQAKEVASRKNPPDYIVTGNEKSNAGEIIKIANEAGVKVFLFNNGFVSPEDFKTYGRPREKYKHWIGELIPNNFSAGYQMGNILINQSLAAGLTAQDGKVHMAAIAGAFKTHASTERVRGLRQAVEENAHRVNLLQVFPGDWTAKKAEQVSMGLLSRYPEVSVIWAANDTTAFGAMNTATSMGLTPGKDILFGGCGWYAPAINKVQEGTLATTVGGHFMEAGWVMVLIHDYHHGRDFISNPIETAMYSIDKSNVEKFTKVFGEQQWNKIDFKKFSKVHNSNLKKYDFSLEAVLQQF